jgi:hypothetical protein
MAPSSHPAADAHVHEGHARPTVELHLQDGRVLEGRVVVGLRGALEDFVRLDVSCRSSAE